MERDSEARPNRRQRRAGRTLSRRSPREAQDLALLTYTAAAQICSVHKDTISLAVQRGDLVSVNAPGTTGNRGKRITRASLVAFQARQLQPVEDPK